MRSARRTRGAARAIAARHGAILAIAVCALLLLGAASGCQTTQETAAEKQAESKRILEAREKRQTRRAKGGGG